MGKYKFGALLKNIISHTICLILIFKPNVIPEFNDVSNSVVVCGDVGDSVLDGSTGEWQLESLGFIMNV